MEPVKNAGDPEQVNTARRKEKLAREVDLDDLRRLVSTDFGRRIVWRLLAHAKMFSSIWEPSALIHYNAGKQDFGHFIWSEVEQADQNALFLMMKENKKEN